MKNICKIFFLTASISFGTAVSAQQKPAGKMIDVFFVFIEKKLVLAPQESSQIRPLVVNYFADQRKIQRETNDPLVREQQKADLKIRYRDRMQPVIGMRRSNRFFLEEQIFRKRVRDELRERKNRGRVN